MPECPSMLGGGIFNDVSHYWSLLESASVCIIKYLSQNKISDILRLIKMAIAVQSRSVLWGSILSLDYLKKFFKFDESQISYIDYFHKCYLWGVKIKENAPYFPL